MTQFNCPHCGNPLKVIAQAGRRNLRRPHWRRFQSVAPTGGLRSLIWWMSGKGESMPIEPEPVREIIAVEQVSADGKHWLMHDLNEAITRDILYTVARAIRCLHCNYSGNGLRQHGITWTTWNYLNKDFLRLSYAEPLSNNANGFQLTADGERFLDECLFRFDPSPPLAGGRWFNRRVRRQRTATNGNGEERH